MRTIGQAAAPLAIAAAAWLAITAGPVQANVYPSGVRILDNDLNILTCDPVAVRYVLNENADGDGVNPGVTIRVRSSTDNAGQSHLNDELHVIFSVC